MLREVLRYISAGAPAGLRRLFAVDACPGTMVAAVISSAAAREPPSMVGAARRRGHTLLVTDRITWCNTCGSYVQAIAKVLLQPCTSSSGKSTQLRRLEAGRHFVSNEVLRGAPRAAHEWS